MTSDETNNENELNTENQDVTDQSDASTDASTDATSTVETTSQPVVGGRKPRHSHEMMIYCNLQVGEDGKIVNPRREGSFGHNAMQLVIDAGEAGISYKDYLKGGGRPNDLGWDLNKGYILTIDPGFDPEVQARKAAEAQEALRAKQAEKEEKAAARAAAKAEKDQKRAEEKAAKDAAKAEADAAKKAAKEQAEAAKKAAAAATPGQVNGSSSVENADKTDESRAATEAGAGPVPTGDAPSTANAKPRRGGKPQNQETGIPV